VSELITDDQIGAAIRLKYQVTDTKCNRCGVPLWVNTQTTMLIECGNCIDLRVMAQEKREKQRVSRHLEDLKNR